MARMHTRRKGQSCSKKPIRESIQDWCKYNDKETIDLILKYWKQGLSTSQIGMILRDQYGIGNIKLITHRKITKILSDNNESPYIPEDLTNLIQKAIRLRKHLEQNKKDLHNKRSLQLTESKVRRLIKYYHRTKVLSKDWIYKPENAEVMLTK